MNPPTSATYWRLARLPVLGGVSFLFTLYSLELTTFGTVLAPLWFPTAIMMVAFWRQPVAHWPAIAAICCTASLCATALLLTITPQAIAYNAINVIEAAIGALLLRRLLPREHPLESLGDWGRLALSSAVIPALCGGILVVVLINSEASVRSFFIWVLSEAIGALALVPLGILLHRRYLMRHRDKKLLVETLLTLIATPLLSWLALGWMPWPFTFVILLLMWSAIRLPRLEAFTVFLVTTMVVSLTMATHRGLLEMPDPVLINHLPWLPFLMILLPANIMTMVMYAFRQEQKHIIESEARFRSAMEYSAIGMALVSTEGKWLQVNQALCALLDYPQQQLKEMTFQQITYPDDLNADLEQLSQLAQGEINSYSLEKRYYTRSGAIVWALLTVSVVRNHDGTPRYYIAQIEDITELKRSEAVNKRLMERITLANEAGGIGIWEWDPRHQQLSWDKRMFELYDVAPHEQPSFRLWLSKIVEEDAPRVEQALNDALARGSDIRQEFRIYRKGTVRHVRIQASQVRDSQGNIERVPGISIDMTEIKQLHDALYQEKERLHITLEAIGEAVICIDAGDRVTFMNPVAEALSGWSQQEALGLPLLTVLPLTCSDSGAAINNIHHTGNQELVLHHRINGRYDIHHSIAPLTGLDGNNIGYVLVMQNVTEARNMLRQLSYSATHDGLTHLANRLSFENQLRQLLQNIDPQAQHALAFIDLDRFKAVNDTAGHAAGDALLQELARLMKAQLRGGDTLARLGGDEFGLILPHCSIDNARQIVENIVRHINDYRLMWNDKLYQVGASAGVTRIDAHNTLASEVMSQADSACYAAKNSGRGKVVAFEAHQAWQQSGQPASRTLSSQLPEECSLQLMVSGVTPPRLPDAISFWLILPQWRTPSGEPLHHSAVGDEWQKALDRKLFSTFFTVHSAALARKGFNIALPISGATLAGVREMAQLAELLLESPLPPSQLHLIVAQDALRADDQTTRENLRRLQKTGCSFILSGIGRDLEILPRLAALPFDYLMLDRQLVQNIHISLMDEIMVTIVHGHADRQKRKTIAGPVEPGPCVDTLAGIGVDFIFSADSQSLESMLSNSYFAIH
nr:diguanylate cyclase [Entomohabitans teleogrylli]